MATKTQRIGHLSGVASVILFATAAITYGNYDFLASPKDIALFLEGNSRSISIAGYVGFLAAFFMLWFSSSLRAYLRTGEGEEGTMSNTAFVGAVATGAIMIVGYAAIQAAGVRAGASSGITMGGGTTLVDFYSVLFGGGIAACIAVMVGASTASAMKTGLFPRWLIYTGLVATVGLISPLSYVFLALGIVWVAIVSLLIYSRST